MHKEKLKDVAEITMGTSPSGDTYNEDENGLPLLNGPTEFGQMSPSCTLFTTDSKRECKSGDLIFCVRGSTTGRMNWADQVYSLGRGVCSIRGNSKLETKYIKYALDYSLRSLLKLAGGGTFPNLTKTTIHNFEIPYPESRFKIASILSAFDDLIENNTRRIEILEEMARQIYREWFVHFRYPGHENDELVPSDTELGEIPEGWEVKQIEDIVDRSNEGLKPIDHPDEKFYYYSFSAYDEGQRPEVIKGEEIKSRKYILDDDAVIISKLNPRIPRIWYAKPKTDRRCLTSTEFLILNGVDGISNAFVHSLLSSHKFYGRFRSLTGGTSTSHQRVKPKDFKKMKIALPVEDLLDEYQEKAGQLFNLAHNLREKNEKLKETRDLMLPKLISGKIDVEELKEDVLG